MLHIIYNCCNLCTTQVEMRMSTIQWVRDSNRETSRTICKVDAVWRCAHCMSLASHKCQGWCSVAGTLSHEQCQPALPNQKHCDLCISVFGGFPAERRFTRVTRLDVLIKVQQIGSHVGRACNTDTRAINLHCVRRCSCNWGRGCMLFWSQSVPLVCLVGGVWQFGHLHPRYRRC